MVLECISEVDLIEKSRAYSRKSGHGCDFSQKGQKSSKKGQNIGKFGQNVGKN